MKKIFAAALCAGFLVALSGSPAHAAQDAQDAGRPRSSSEFVASGGAVPGLGIVFDAGHAQQAVHSDGVDVGATALTAPSASAATVPTTDGIPHAPPVVSAAPAGHDTTTALASPHPGVTSAQTHHDEHAAAGAESDEAAGPEPINWFEFGKTDKHGGPWPPLVALLINFAIFAFVYVRFGKKPIADGLQERRDAIAKDIENAAKILAEAKARAVTYQVKLGSKDEDAREATEGLVRSGEVEKERILVEAASKAARMKKDAAFLLEQEIKQLQQDLVRDTVERSIAQAEALLVRGVTVADQERLAEEYLATLTPRKAVGAT